MTDDLTPIPTVADSANDMSTNPATTPAYPLLRPQVVDDGDWSNAKKSPFGVVCDEYGLPKIRIKSYENSCFTNLFFRTSKNPEQNVRCKACPVSRECKMAIGRVLASDLSMRKHVQRYLYEEGGANREAPVGYRNAFEDHWKRASESTGLDAVLARADGQERYWRRIDQHGYDKPMFERSDYDRKRYAERSGATFKTPHEMACEAPVIAARAEEFVRLLDRTGNALTGVEASRFRARRVEAPAIFRALHSARFQRGTTDVTPSQVWKHLSPAEERADSFTEGERKRVRRLMDWVDDLIKKGET